MPTLLVGDFILVNKFTYGIRLPVINKKVIELNEPKRGDIVVSVIPNSHQSIILSVLSVCLATRWLITIKSFTSMACLSIRFHWEAIKVWVKVRI